MRTRVKLYCTLTLEVVDRRSSVCPMHRDVACLAYGYVTTIHTGGLPSWWRALRWRLYLRRRQDRL